MLSLVLPPERRGPLKLLCLGAHADDIEIGCGGTVLRLAVDVPDLVVRWIVFSGAGLREVEARNSAAAFLENISEKQIEVHIPPAWAALPRTGRTNDTSVFAGGAVRGSVHKFGYGHKQGAAATPHVA